MAKKGGDTLLDYIIRVAPFHFLHVKDTNSNMVRIVEGPTTLTCLDHEKVVYGPVPMIVVPPNHYVVIDNPVVRKHDGEVLTDEHGQPVHRFGDKEIRFSQPPFSLYDNERAGTVTKLRLVDTGTALKLRALRDFEDRYSQFDGEVESEDEDEEEEEEEEEVLVEVETKSTRVELKKKNKVHRKAGEEWLFKGRQVYQPQVEVEVVEVVKSVVLKWNQALKLRATADCLDFHKNPRKAGEEWIIRKIGAYLPSVTEQIVEVISGNILTDTNALHVRAKNTFTDNQRVERKAGTEWLVTAETTELYIPAVNEEIVQPVQLINLGPHDYCIILDPVEDGKNQLGKRKIVRGITSFFLKPGESVDGIKQSTMLGPTQGLWLTATEEFIDNYGGRRSRRRPGDIWLTTGPGEYWPVIEAKVQSEAKARISIEFLGVYIFRPALIIANFLLLIALYFLFQHLYTTRGD